MDHFDDPCNDQGMSVITFMLFMMISAHPIHAYLDQGTGSMVVQIIAASVFGGTFLIKSFWRKTILFWKSIIPKEKEQSSR
jgi:hypothetical protein